MVHWHLALRALSLMDLNFSRPSDLPSSFQWLLRWAWVLCSVSLSWSPGGCYTWMSGGPEMLRNWCLWSPPATPCRNNLSKCLRGTDCFAHLSGIPWGTCYMLTSRIPYGINLLIVAVCLIIHCLWLLPFPCIMSRLTGVPWDQLSNILFIPQSTPWSDSGKT